MSLVTLGFSSPSHSINGTEILEPSGSDQSAEPPPIVLNPQERLPAVSSTKVGGQEINLSERVAAAPPPVRRRYAGYDRFARSCPAYQRFLEAFGADILLKAAREDIVSSETAGVFFLGCGEAVGDEGLEGPYFDAAREIFTAFSAKGSTESLFQLARMQERGFGTEADPLAAVEIYTRAAERGNFNAQKRLSEMYLGGEGIPADNRKAVHWLKSAAEQGDAWLQIRLGYFYQQGELVDRDTKLAADWYLRASENGHAVADIALGRLYLSGDGLPQSSQRAISSFRDGARMGEGTGDYYIGIILEHGIGIEMDRKLARDHYRAAALAGRDEAKYALGRLLQKLVESDALIDAYFENDATYAATETEAALEEADHWLGEAESEMPEVQKAHDAIVLEFLAMFKNQAL